MNDPPVQAPPERHAFQVNLRQMFLAIAVVCALFGVFAQFGPVGLFLCGLLFAGVAFVMALNSRAMWRQYLLLCALMVACTTVTLIWWAGAVGRPEARRMTCHHNLILIGGGLLNYNDANGSLPPAYTSDATGQRLHSWRTLVLNYMEIGWGVTQFLPAEPWDGPTNRAFATSPKWPYQCPCVISPQSNCGTSYLALIGPGTAWPGSTPIKLSDLGDRAATTILVVEVADAKINWMEPRDLDISELKARIDNGTVSKMTFHKGGLMALMADGNVQFLSYSKLEEIVNEMLAASGSDLTESKEE